jgi:hypothetical protein
MCRRLMRLGRRRLNLDFALWANPNPGHRQASVGNRLYYAR